MRAFPPTLVTVELFDLCFPRRSLCRVDAEVRVGGDGEGPGTSPDTA